MQEPFPNAGCLVFVSFKGQFTMDDLTLILCDSKNDAHQTVKAERVLHLPKGLHEVSAGELNTQADTASTKWLGLSRSLANLSAAEIGESRKLLPSDPKNKMLLVFSKSQSQAIDAWKNLPPRVAALRQNWAKTVEAVVFLTSFIKEHPFADTPDPVWDLMIKISRSPESIQVGEVRDDSEAKNVPPSSKRPGLTPSVPDSSTQWLKAHLQAVTPLELAPGATSPPDAIALKAGLLQIHDYLDESHELSQSIEGEGRNKAGDYWHAIMHRREPDYGNSKYWFRHVGSHPIFEPLREAVETLLAKSDHPSYQHARQKLLAKNHWDPMAFVDLCEDCAKGQDPVLTRIAEEIQWREMCLLLEQTYRDATG